MKKSVLAALLLMILCTLCACALQKPELPELSLVTATPVPTIVPTPEPTPEPTPIPTPTPTPVPTPTPDDGTRPNAIGIYIPGSGSTRVRQDVFSGKWVKGRDIDCFEAIASMDAEIKGGSFRKIFNEAWEKFPNRDGYKIGYILSYTVEEGREISVTITSPEDVQYTEYVECWLYDDIHQTPGVRYSHLEERLMKEETLITSIKLTCGKKIDAVDNMRLAAFLYHSEQEFDSEGHYTGSLIHEITIQRQ